MLARSAFPRLDLRGAVVTRTLSADAVVGFVYSHSDTSPEALGDQRMAFEAALRHGLAQLSPAGVFRESVQVTAVIASRAS